MMLLEPRLEPVEDLDGFGDGGLADIDLLESSRQGSILLEDPAVFMVGRRSDAPQIAGCKHWLDEVGRIHDAAGRGAGADDGMDFVDEENCAFLFVQLREYRLQPFFEVAAILGTGEQRTEIECVDVGAREHLGYVAVDDHLGEALRDRGLADAGFTHEQRVVLSPPA